MLFRSGVSPFTFFLKREFREVAGLDLTDAFGPRCAAAGIRLYQGGVNDAASLEGIEKVDCVFFLEVLEHLHSNPVEVLRNAGSLLKPGGLLIVTTPNMACFANRILMLGNRKLRLMDYPPFAIEDSAHGFAHDRIYMPQELYEYGVASGLEQVEVAYQLNRDDIAQEGRSSAARMLALIPRLAKRCVPSFRDGVVLLARKGA